MSTTTNYREVYFAHEDLDKIAGEPSYDTLRTIHTQLKANAASVPSILGGGANGHLGLVIAPEKYALISNTPFNRPYHPGLLDVPIGTLRDEADRVTNAHRQQLDLYNTVQGVEKSLLQQLTKAVEPVYLESLKNQNTGLIQYPIFTVLAHLKSQYGNVHPHEYTEAHNKVTAMTYSIESPIDTVFTALRDLLDISEAANANLQADQAILIAYNILNKTNAFNEDLIAWNRKQDEEKTWDNFQQHFRDAYKQRRSTTNKAIHNTSFGEHHANMIASQVAEQLYQRAYDEEQGPSPPPGYQEMTQPVVDQQHQANAVVQNNTVNALMQQVQQLNQTMQNMQLQMNNQQSNRSNSTNGNNQNQNQGGGNQNNRSNRSGTPRKKYCWTHGSCDHASRNCNNPAQGHQHFATFRNRMGGNNYMCQRTNNNQAQSQNPQQQRNQYQQQPQFQNQQQQYQNQNQQQQQYQNRNQQQFQYQPQQQYQNQQTHQQNQRYQAPGPQNQRNRGQGYN